MVTNPDFDKAFPTLFMPIEVPRGSSEDENDAVMECFRAFLDAASSDLVHDLFVFHVNNSTVVDHVLGSMRSMSEGFCDLHLSGERGRSNADGLASGLIHSSLRDLRPGGYWGMWVPAQNGILLLHRGHSNDETQDVVRVYVWEAQAPNDKVMKNDGSIRQACPRSATCVPWERFLQPSTAEWLRELATETPTRAIPMSSKAGHEFEETRDVFKPMYLTECFLASLGGKAIATETIQGVHKKMRDKVIYSGGMLPWRRAPVWAALKGLLHVVCVMETTKQTGMHAANSQVIYKVFLQNFLAFCLDKANRISSSAIVEGGRKISRRVVKVKQLYKNPWSEDRFFRMSTSFCKKVVEEKMKSCEDEWKEKCKASVKCDVDLSKIKPQNDVVHQLKSSLPVLTKLVQLKEDFYRLDKNSEIPEPTGRRLLADQKMSCRLLEDHKLEIEKTFKCWEKEPQDAIGQLHDVAISISTFFMDIRNNENNARIFLTRKDEADNLVTPLMKLLGSYSISGLEMYNKDPRGCGEIVLLSLTLVLILDMLACEHYPILKEHKLGIEPGFLHYILVSAVPNKKLLFELEGYVNERNSQSSYPSSIEPTRSDKSLSVRFTKRDPEMEATLASIQQRCKSNQDNKEMERQTEKERYDDLQNKIRREGSCKCYDTYDCRGMRTGKVKCYRCDLADEANGIKIWCYEKMLPPKANQQRAVVFELKQPKLLAGQRNAILVLNEELCCKKWYSKTDRYLWLAESRLYEWKTNVDIPLQVCELGSKRKKFSSSHYNNSYHVTKRDSFVVEHDYLTELMGGSGIAKKNLDWNIKPALFSVELKADSRYKNLEGFFNSFSHSENDIIAAKSKASEEISLIEFEKVGTLRAGAKHQLIRLSSSLVQKDVPLEREEIVSLVQSIIWQAGPPCSLNEIFSGLGVIYHIPTSWYRQQSEILKASTFVEDVCDQLLLTIDECASNWANQNILLNVIHIAIYVFEHVLLDNNTAPSEKVIAKIVDVITKCRNIAKQWIDELTVAFDSAIDDTDKQTLRARIAYVSAIGAFTYRDSDDLLSTGDDIGLWIFFRVLFNANFAPAQIRQGSDCRSHFFHAFAVAEAIELRLHGLLYRDKSGLDKFLELYWDTSFASNCDTAQNWKQYESRHWFHLDYNDGNVEYKLQIDIIAGTLLVNGSPPKNLPRSVTSHKIFSRLFEKSTFMVKPTLGNFGYRTSSKVDGFFYEFYPLREDRFDEAPLIIKGCEYFRAILIPWYMFEGDLPEQLVNEYSQWFILDAPIDGQILKDCVYFCPRSYKASRLSPKMSPLHHFLDTTTYILDCEQCLLIERKTNKKFIDVRSETFKELYSKVFSRLTSRLRIHVSISSTIGEPIMIKIPILQNMRFAFDQNSGVVRSSDFRGLRVSKDQNFGCLVGIQHGLLLEGDSDFENRIFLCPHGRVSRSNDGSVSIDIKKIQSPAFFRFEVRPELKELRSCTKDRTASLFLALLHAVTSGILADPSTGTTGTQRALTILRSGRCSGNLINSFEEKEIKESIIAEARILCEIACISYFREDFHSMEKNDTISSNYDALCANSAFAFLVQIMLENLNDALKVIGKDNETMPYLTQDQEQDLSCRTSTLSRRAYFQYREMRPKDSLLSKEEEEQIFGSLAVKDASFLPLPYYFDRQTINLAQEIGFESQNHCYIRSDANSLFSLLCSPNINVLQGITGTVTLIGGPMQCFVSLPDPMIVNSAAGLTFYNIWLNLYHVCQTQVDNTDKKTSISFLLTWIMMEYPDMEIFLRQLSMIAAYPNEFPSMIDYGVYNVTLYDKPHENNYSISDVDEAINSHLEKFTEGEPSQSYHRNRWETRRVLHRNTRCEESKSLNSQIRLQWENGSMKITITGCFSKLTSRCNLEKEIYQLFKRWREAERLHNFIEDVTKRLEGLTIDECPILFPLNRDQTKDALSLRSEFVLSTAPSFARLELKNDSKAELLNIEPYTLPLHSLAVGQTSPLQMSEISFLRDSSFMNKNSNYKEVWNALVGPLTNSLRLACDESDFSTSNFDSLRSEIELHLKKYAQTADSTFEKLYRRISSLFRSETNEEDFFEIQKKVSLWDSTGPYDLLLHYSKESTCNGIKNELISFAMSIKHVQRARRCLRLLIDGSGGLRMHLLNDLSIRFSKSNPGLNESWNAYKNPEFIMFEVDNDISIRDTQAQVAFEILKEKNETVSTTNNRLMQLNMGEGKTAIIMPIVLARAARGDKVVRATVLSSLYTTNSSDWQYKLGGLLNRRVYPMICRRDLPIGVDGVKMMLKTCRKIKEEKHVIVTVPEHRLSLENKAIELASNLTMGKDLNASKSLHEVVNFLWRHGREFLDESDEILSPKYQLIYTIGAPRDMEGSQLRWEIHASIYESLARHASSLVNDFGSDVIELGKSISSVQETEYIGLRLLEGSEGCDEAYNAIKKYIKDDILNNHSKLKVTLRKDERQKWEKCVNGSGSGDDLEGLPDSSKVIALCLRGMLEHNVLKISLFKRWRVHYGNHPTRKGFNMAVPYRAKDVAAERTEFGHPDVALSLTFAHYYQAGLERNQLRDVFERLKRMSDSDAKAEYSNWVGSGQMTKEMEGFASYEGVNIEDSAFFETRLFPIFRNNMRVIRFWLVKIVLPVQAKQFPKKLSSTAPELCRSPQLGKRWTAVTTGFSGTDDLSLLLSPTIVQANLQSLKKTNGVQLKNILRKENNHYSYLVDENTTNELLKRFLATTSDNSRISDINVVLDAGALVLHKSNRNFIESWLHIRKDMEAAAFFEGSTIFVLTQDGDQLKFDASPYCEDMSRCLLYLDDIHTRGSDFRLPLNARAVLTLGKGLQKDKFVQACMRMRQLGRGQSLLLVASREVNRVLENDFGLNTGGDKELGFVSAILEWTISNSVKRICDLMPYFIDQMRSTFRKANAYNKFFANSNALSLESIADACIEDEVLELKQLYGHECGDELLPTIVDRRLNERSLFGKASERTSTEIDDSRRSLVELADTLKERIRRLAPHIRLPCNMLDEEQERELEQELEEEIQVERPPPAVALKSHFSEGLREVLRRGQYRPDTFPELCKRYLLPLRAIFCGTDFSESPIGSQLNTEHVFVTKDFVDTVKGNIGKDCFMKNFRWFLKWNPQKKKMKKLRWLLKRNPAPGLPVIAVSNFEAEALSNLLESEMRDFFVPRKRFPSLYAFAAITRLQQPRIFLTDSSCEPSVALHICAGSVHADEDLATEIRNFLSVFPRPQTPKGMKTWDTLFNDGHIHRDGFVSPEHRKHVDRKSSVDEFDGPNKGLFRSSPVRDLRHFYGDCRHLSSELPNSSIGRLLGVSELGSDSDEDEDDA